LKHWSICRRCPKPFRAVDAHKWMICRKYKFFDKRSIFHIWCLIVRFGAMSVIINTNSLTIPTGYMATYLVGVKSQNNRFLHRPLVFKKNGIVSKISFLINGFLHWIFQENCHLFKNPKTIGISGPLIFIFWPKLISYFSNMCSNYPCPKKTWERNMHICPNLKPLCFFSAL